MSPHYPMLFPYPSNPTTGITTRQDEPLDLSVKKSSSTFAVAPYKEQRINLEEKLQTLLSYYESLSKENSLLRAQEQELLVEIQVVRNALLSPNNVHEEDDDDVDEYVDNHEEYVSGCAQVPDLDLRFAVSKGFKERSFVKRRQSSLSTITSSSSSCSYSSEEDAPNESKTDILVVKKKKKMEQNKLASRRFRERKKAHWSQTVQEADRLQAINKELRGKANELELKIKWIKEALRKTSSTRNTNSLSLEHVCSPSPLVVSPCNTN